MEWVTFGLIAVNIFSYGTFLYVIRAAGPVFAAQAGYFSMLIGVLSGMLMFDERHSAWVWVALGLMVVGMTLVKERPRPDLIQLLDPAHANRPALDEIGIRSRLRARRGDALWMSNAASSRYCSYNQTLSSSSSGRQTLNPWQPSSSASVPAAWSFIMSRNFSL